MSVYIFLMFFSVLILFILRFTKNKELDYVLKGLWLIIIVFISGFRLDLGHDYPGYKRNFEDVDARESVEPFITIISKILYNLNLPYVFLFFLFSLFTFYFLLKFLEKQNVKIVYLCVLIFIALPHFYFQTYNLIRQMLAVIVFAYSTTIINSKIKYICYILFCVIVHQSVLFILPIVILLEKFKQFKIDKWLYLVSLIFFYNSNLAQSLLISIGEKLNLPYVELYILAPNLDNVEMNTGPMLIINILFTFFILYKKKEFSSISLQREYNYFITGQILFNFLAWDSTLIRISYYFLFFYILIIPAIVLLYKKELSVIIQFFLFIIFLAFFFYSIMSTNNPFVPYKNYFF